MRLDASLLVFGLSALGNLPLGSARVLYDYAGPNDLVAPSHNATNIEQRAVIVAPKPVPKPVVEPPVVGPDAPVAPGGDAPIAPGGKSPLGPGDTAPGSEPAPLIPDKDPAPVADKDPAPATDKDTAPATDKDPAAPVTDKDGAPAATDKDNAPLTKEEQTDLDLFCPAESLPGTVVKRTLEARGRDGRCSTRAGDRRGKELNDYYDGRYSRAEEYVRGRPYSNVDNTARTEKYYRTEREESPEPFIGDTLERTGLKKRGYDFSYEQERYGDWSTHSTYSPGNTREPVSRISYGRNPRDPEEMAMIAHERFADRDSRRYQLDSKGRAKVDSEGRYINAERYKDEAVAVSDLTHQGAKRGQYFDRPYRRMSFVSEDIQGVESRRLIDDAFTDMGRPDDTYQVLNRDSKSSPERRAYGRVTSNDNNYSWMNTATRNPEYADLQPRRIETFRSKDRRKYDTAYHWER